MSTPQLNKDGDADVSAAHSDVSAPLLQGSPAKGFLQRLTRALWGYDFFVSYHWASGGTYAVGLAEKLRDRKYDCFLDRAEFAGGDNWRKEAELAIRSTRRLVVVATREAISDSEPVRHEIDLFTRRSSRVVPIVFGARFSDEEREKLSVLEKIPVTMINILEPAECLETGPSESAINDLVRTHRLMRRRTIRRIIVATAFVALSVATVFTFSSWRTSEAQRIIARQALFDSQRELARNLINRGIDEAVGQRSRSGLFRLLRAYEMSKRIGLAADHGLPEDELMSDSARRVLASAASSVGIGLLHGEMVYAVRFSPDGEMVRTLTANIDGEPTGYHFWNAVTGQRQGFVSVDDSVFQGFEMSPDWRKAVLFSGDSFDRYDIDSGARAEVPVEALAKQRYVDCIYSLDLELCATVIEGRLSLWSTSTGEELHNIPGKFDDAQKLAFAPGGEALFVLAAEARRFWLIDVESGEIRPNSGALAAAVRLEGFSPDGLLLAIREENEHISLWSVRNGQRLSPTGAGLDPVKRLITSPQGDVLVVRSSGSLSLIDPSTAAPLGQPFEQPAGLDTVQFSPDGKEILGVAKVQARENARAFQFRIWDIATREVTKEFEIVIYFDDTPDTGSPVVQYSPDGRRLLLDVSGISGIYESATGRLIAGPWNASGGKFSADGNRLQYAMRGIRDVTVLHMMLPKLTMVPPGRNADTVIARDAPVALSVVSGKTMQTWDIETGEPLVEPWLHPDNIGEFSLTPDGNWIITTNSASARTWNARTGELVRTFSHEQGDSIVSGDGRLIVVHEDGLWLWDLDSDSPARSVPLWEELDQMVFSRDLSRMIATSYDDDLLHLWDVESGCELRAFDGLSGAVQDPEEPETFTHLLFAPDGSSVLSVSSYTAVRLWDTATGRLIRDFTGHQADIESVAFSADGEILATGHRGVAQLWNVATGNLYLEYKGHGRNIESIAFSKDGHYLLTAANSVLRWPIPSIPDNPPHIRAWVLVRSLSVLNESGSVQPIGTPSWNESWRELNGLGGPFEANAGPAGY